MFRTVTFILAITGLTLGVQELNNPGLQQLNAEMIDTDNAEDFLGFQPRIPSTFSTRIGVNATIVYSIGARTEDDRLAGTYIKSDSWGTPKNVAWRLSYPFDGEQANITRITYAEATLNQSSPLGYAFVVSGGPGKNRISVVVGAIRTQYFGVEAKIYGV